MRKLLAPIPKLSPLTTPTLGEAPNPSTSEQQALVEHIRKVGAVFYVHLVVPRLLPAKSLFGKEAGRRLPCGERLKGELSRRASSASFGQSNLPVRPQGKASRTSRGTGCVSSTPCCREGGALV